MTRPDTGTHAPGHAPNPDSADARLDALAQPYRAAAHAGDIEAARFVLVIEQERARLTARRTPSEHLAAILREIANPRA